MTWTIYYIWLSIKEWPGLPWDRCDPTWASASCTVRTLEAVGVGVAANVSGAVNATNATVKGTTASQEFWQHYVLQQSDGIHDLGSIRWELLLCLVIAWVAVYVCLFKGVKTSGKVVYVTATFPYVVLLALLVRGLTLPGAMKGIQFFLLPDFNRLKEFRVWGDAATQIFYSVAPGWGGILTYSSFNKFRHNCHR